MNDVSKLEAELSEETTQKTEESKKEVSKRMQTLMEIQYGKDLSDGEIRASARLLSRKKTMMMCFKFLLKNGQSSVAEIRDGIRAEVENILSETDFERETLLKNPISQGTQGKPIQVPVNVPEFSDKRENLYKLGEKLPSGERKSGVSQQTVSKLCQKMAHAGVLNAYTTALHRGFTFYEISDRFRKHVDQVLRAYRRMFSMRAYKLVSYQGTLENDLKKNPEFLKLCGEFLISVDEGVQSLVENQWKVSTSVHENVRMLSRRQQ